MLEILIEVAKIMPVVAVLWILIIWLKRAYLKKEDEIAELNSEIKQLNSEINSANKQNLSLLYKVLSFFEKIDDTNKSQHTAVLKDIETMKQSIIEKINNIK